MNPRSHEAFKDADAGHYTAHCLHCVDGQWCLGGHVDLLPPASCLLFSLSLSLSFCIACILEER